jgi:hypothetical protein
MESLAHLTPYPAVNALIRELLAGVQSVLGDRFTGLYLSGSLAAGDFDPQRSDIDFIVVISGDLPAEMLPALTSMHAGLSNTGLGMALRLEGAYVPLAALRRYDPAIAWHPSLAVGGAFDLDHQRSDGIIQRHILREHALAVAGPNLHSLIDPVTPDDLRRAALATLRDWWAPMLDNPFRLWRREYQAYAVLTMCRICYTLHFGEIVSKQAAARWMQETQGERWVALIQRALEWQSEDGVDDVGETLDFISFTLDCGL